VREAVAVPAKKIASRSIQLGDAPPAGDSIEHAGTNEIGPSPTEAAGHAHDADGLGHILPLVPAELHAIGEMQPIMLGEELDPGDSLAFLCPLPGANPAGAEAAPPLQLVDVDGTAGFHGVTPRSAAPSGSAAAHYSPPFFLEIVWKLDRHSRSVFIEIVWKT